MVDLSQALPGIWFWEAPHPDWEPGESWDQDVRSWVLRTDAGLVLVDPLVRDDVDRAAWEPLDRLVAEQAPVVAVIRTLHYHHRSAAQASARYDVPIYARPVPRDDVPAHPFDLPLADGVAMLGGLTPHELERDDEVALWLPEQQALLFSDVGQRRHGRFELCPEFWVQSADSWTRLRDQIAALADHEPRHLLVSHGEHRLDDAAELAPAVARAAARPLSPFIDLGELRGRRGDNYKLVDARFYLDGRSGRDAFEAGHLPGALYVDMTDVLSAPHADDSHGRHPLPSPERFAAGLAAAGISDGDTVVAYDDAGGVIAARLVWMLRVTGHDAALLDGGISATAEREQGAGRTPTAGNLTPVPWPADRLADIDDAANSGAAATPSHVLIDARDGARFAGGPDPHDPRSGHIPGAVNVPCRGHVDANGRIAGRDVLREIFAAAGIDDNTEVISYCGSGVTACHNLLALEQARLKPGRLYPGSWSEWSRQAERPIAT